MNNEEKELKIREIMKGIRLESPGPEFTSMVMGAILKETEKRPAFVTEPLLGKKFWILLAAFALLALVLVLTGSPQEGTGFFQKYLSGIPSPDLRPFSESLSSAFSQTGSLTWTVMLVLLGGSGLILTDKLLGRKHSVSLS